MLLAAETTGTVDVVDVDDGELRQPIAVGGPYGPFGVEIDPEAGVAYVSGRTTATSRWSTWRPCGRWS